MLQGPRSASGEKHYIRHHNMKIINKPKKKKKEFSALIKELRDFRKCLTKALEALNGR